MGVERGGREILIAEVDLEALGRRAGRLEHDAREARVEGGGVVAGEIDAGLLTGLHGHAGRLVELTPGARGLALLLVADGEVEQRAELGVEALALGELAARLGDLAGVEQLPRLAEERLGGGELRDARGRALRGARGRGGRAEARSGQAPRAARRQARRDAPTRPLTGPGRGGASTRRAAAVLLGELERGHVALEVLRHRAGAVGLAAPGAVICASIRPGGPAASSGA
jgi:hypothetical protein